MDYVRLTIDLQYNLIYYYLFLGVFLGDTVVSGRLSIVNKSSDFVRKAINFIFLTVSRALFISSCNYRKQLETEICKKLTTQRHTFKRRISFKDIRLSGILPHVVPIRYRHVSKTK